MKISEVVCQVLRLPKVAAKTDSSQDAAIIRIRTDDGLEGIGEVAAQPEVVKAVVDAPFSHNVACGLRDAECAHLQQKGRTGRVRFALDDVRS